MIRFISVFHTIILAREEHRYLERELIMSVPVLCNFLSYGQIRNV
jgi:hypothetical protein